MRVPKYVSERVMELGLAPEFFFYLVTISKLSQDHLNNERYMELLLDKWGDTYANTDSVTL